MKELFRILRESDKLGYKLSAICGVNWLLGQLFKWQSLVFEMIACAILIKKIQHWYLNQEPFENPHTMKKSRYPLDQ